MNIQHLQYPFYHTIIYNFFDVHELNLINAELHSLFTSDYKIKPDDEHHLNLLNKDKTQDYNLDIIYENRREQSNILMLIKKIYTLDNNILDTKQNPFLSFIKASNHDNTRVNKYHNLSSYSKHHDNAVLTMMYPFWKDPKEFEGGDLFFANHEYKPYLKNNSCVIFPSYEMHELTQIKSKNDNVNRVSINQRVFIVPKETT
jgi:Rps23 Pro-64 3,4-dihydroxylase Tpa1-like proline 4-hydroxylase